MTRRQKDRREVMRKEWHIITLRGRQNSATPSLASWMLPYFSRTFVSVVNSHYSRLSRARNKSSSMTDREPDGGMSRGPQAYHPQTKAQLSIRGSASAADLANTSAGRAEAAAASQHCFDAIRGKCQHTPPHPTPVKRKPGVVKLWNSLQYCTRSLPSLIIHAFE